MKEKIKRAGLFVYTMALVLCAGKSAAYFTENWLGLGDPWNWMVGVVVFYLVLIELLGAGAIGADLKRQAEEQEQVREWRLRRWWERDE